MTRIQQELSLVVHQRLMNDGFDYDARVTCTPGSAVRTLNCDVLVTNPPPGHHVEWTWIVICAPVASPNGAQRCSDQGNNALQ